MKNRSCSLLSSLIALFLASNALGAAGPLVAPKSRGDLLLADYFRAETLKLADRCLQDVHTLDDWNARKGVYRQQLREMLGLEPMPARTDLKPEITGRIDHEQFTVENLHFQSMPGLYVTANLYLPKGLTKPAPAILYVCGHASVVSNGVSYGNKTAYQHHGIWFARNGYVCLVLDTIQLGEIQGLHHGTYREGMWWWNARGYTPAGAEAWNCIRALDYLETRPAVDKTRFGVTGRSGGGAYSWWVAALDDRIKVAAPVAGITDLRNHVIDGTVEGHCDCMFTVNTHRWDYAQVAALVAPRPLLLCNSDKDTIFPLDGVVRLHSLVRRIYGLHKATTNLGLLITEGPHKDTQDLQLPVFRWFNRHLKGEDPVIAMPTERLFRPEQLKVFASIPADERTSKIHETFVPLATPSVPSDQADWIRQRQGWMKALKEHVFGAWADEVEPGAAGRRFAAHGPQIVQTPKPQRAFAAKRQGLGLEAWDFPSQPDLPLRLYVLRGGRVTRAAGLTVQVLDEAGWDRWLAGARCTFSRELTNEVAERPAVAADAFALASLSELVAQAGGPVVFLVPRGIGLTAWGGTEKDRVQIRRRFLLLGQTLDGMRVWDIRQGLAAVRSIRGFERLPIQLHAEGNMAVNALSASLFAPDIALLELSQLPASHRTGPDYLNVLRFLDLEQAVAMAAERSRVRLIAPAGGTWDYLRQLAMRLAWGTEHVEVAPGPAVLNRGR